MQNQPQAILSPKQARTIVEATAEYHRWLLMIGATRSGKTWTQYLLAPHRIRERIPGLYVAVAKTLGNVESNILHPMRELYGSTFVSRVYRRDGLHKACVFGKEFLLVGADNIRAVDKLRGKGIGYCMGDEGPTWPPEVIQMLKTRMTHERARADITGNPEGPRHHFKVDLIDRADELGVKHIQFGLDDNPTLSGYTKQQLRTELQGVWYKRLILGQWVAAEGAVYDNLDDSRHVVDSLPDDHVRYFVSADYGTGTVTTFWLAAIDSGGTVYLVDRLRWDAAEKMRQKSDLQFCNDLQAWLDRHGIKPEFIVVPSDAQSFIVQLKHLRPLSAYPRLGRLIVDPREPGSVVDGIRDVYSLIAQDRLLFLRKVVDAGGLDEMTGYVWDPKAQERGEDVPLKSQDHDPDAIRYLIRATKHIWSRALRKAA